MFYFMVLGNSFYSNKINNEGFVVGLNPMTAMYCCHCDVVQLCLWCWGVTVATVVQIW